LRCRDHRIATHHAARSEFHGCAEGLETGLQVFGSERLNVRFAFSTRSAALVYEQCWRVFQKAASSAGIGRLGTHSLRHTYRSLLDSVGTPLAVVQQKLMRQTDIRATMKVYEDVITNAESEALAKRSRALRSQSDAAPRELLRNGERGRNRTFNLLIKSTCGMKN